MRRIVLLLLPFWLPTLLLGQNLSGKWKGVFAPNQDQDGKVYSYEVEIKELPNHTLSVVTYTKFSNNFSAKECEGASGNLLQISAAILRASV